MSAHALFWWAAAVAMLAVACVAVFVVLALLVATGQAAWRGVRAGRQRRREARTREMSEQATRHALVDLSYTTETEPVNGSDLYPVARTVGPVVPVGRPHGPNLFN